MKIQLSSSAFTAACEQAVRVIPSKNPIPILSNLRFDVSDSVLHILGSTPDISFRSNVDVACDGSEVSFCLNPKFFLDAIKGLPEQLLTIEVDTDNFEISFSYNDGKGNFHVPGSSATEYPLRSELKEAHSFVINGRC